MAGASAPALPEPDRRRAKSKAAWRRRKLVLALMSPWIVGFSVFLVYPLVMNGYLSLTHYDLLNPPRWIGFANYQYAFTNDPNLWPAIKNTLWIIAVGVPLQVLFAFGIAMMLTRARAGVGVFRTVFYLPALVPPVAATLGFVYIFNPGTGPVNTILAHLGITGPLWFNDPAWAKPSLVLLSMWGIGTFMIVFLAAILDVPKHLYESAELDGAGPFQRLRWVTLPHDQPGDPVLGRARGDLRPPVLHAGLRRGEHRRPGTPHRPVRSARSSSATRRARRSSTRSSSTTTASSTSTWATPRRWRFCCSPSRSRSRW